MITVRSLTKRFEGVTAVDEVSFEVSPGRVVGLLGHNGAGKTTIIRLLAGLLARDEGDLELWGHDPELHGEAVRARLGVLPSRPVADTRLTAWENLRFVAATHRLDEQWRSRAEELLARFNLAERAHDRVSEYSAGMRQRISLARVLLSAPEALLLDEPTSAMDPVGARDLRAMLVDSVSDARTAVVLCTHDLAEAAQLCDEVLILSSGGTVRRGSPADLVAGLGAETTWRVTEDPVATTTAQRVVWSVDPSAVSPRSGEVVASHLDRGQIPGLVQELVRQGIEVFAVSQAVPSLEDLYLQLHDAPAQALPQGITT